MDHPHFIPVVKKNRIMVSLTISIFLFIVFFFAKPYDWFSSIQDLSVASDAVEMAKIVEQGNIKRQIAFCMLALFGVLSLMMTGLKGLRVNGILGWILILFLGWAICSIYWADNPIIALRRVTIILCISLGAFAISIQFSTREIVTFAFVTCSLTLLSGIVSEIILKSFKPFIIEYRFAGVLPWNSMGRHCAVLFLSAQLFAQKKGGGRWIFRIVQMVGLTFLILTKSRMEFFGAILASFIFWYLITPRFRFAAVISFLFFLFSIFSLLLLLFFFDPIAHYWKSIAFLGRDTDALETLTGRIPLWIECIKYIAERPFLGYGYNAFWTPSHLYSIADAIGGVPGHAHSSLLEMALSVGIIGTCTFVLIVALVLVRLFKLFKRSQKIDYAFFAILVIYFSWTSLLNCPIFSNDILAFLIISIFCKVGFMKNLPYESNALKHDLFAGSRLKSSSTIN